MYLLKVFLGKLPFISCSSSSIIFFLITYLPLLIEFTFFPINYRLKDYLPSTLYALNAILNILHVLPHSSSPKTSGHFFHGRQKEIVNKTA